MKQSRRIFVDLRQSLLVKTIKSGIGLFPLTLQGLITLIVTALCLSMFGYGSMDLVVFALAILRNPKFGEKI